MLPSNIVFRTFFIKAEQYGTAFTIDVEGEQYLITAKHLLSDAGESVSLRIMINKSWAIYDARVVGRCNGEIDIAVLKLPSRLTAPEFQVLPTMGEIMLAQDVYFLGFPYKMWIDYGETFQGLPGAFVKRGTLSAVHTGEIKLMYIDAINNEGFSGGPVYFSTRSNPHEIRVAGVVSKYKIEHEPVLDDNGNRTSMTVPYNTGFLIAYGIKHALDIIGRHADA